MTDLLLLVLWGAFHVAHIVLFMWVLRVLSTLSKSVVLLVKVAVPQQSREV